VVATLVQVFINSSDTLPIVGASGAISGILGAYLVFYPSSSVTTVIPFGLFMRVVELPALLYMFIWFALQLIGVLWSSLMPADNGGSEAGGIAFFAHIGGFLCGLLLARFIGPDVSAAYQKLAPADYMESLIKWRDS
jgi:membrane associated rhomboid family serine protease